MAGEFDSSWQATRRGLLKAGAAGALTGALPAGAAAATRPNIVVILADDLGFSDFGCFGSEIPTPNIDAMAKRGLRFTQFYNNARCSPSRAALLTGAHPHQAGLGHLAGRTWPEARGVLGGLADRVTTIPEVLRGAGYFTAMAGKWHLGTKDGQWPWQRGFERSFTLPAGGIYFREQPNGRHPGHAFVDGRRIPITSPEVAPGDWYGTDVWTDWAIRYADQARAAKKPYFIYLPHVAPHFPLMAPEADIARFRGKYRAGWEALREARYRRQQEMGLIGPNQGLTPMLETTTPWESLGEAARTRFDTMMAVYAAVVSRLDASIGRLVADLEAKGDLDNTLILILSDNGGNAESGPRGRTGGQGPIGSSTSNVFSGMNWATLQNTPFRYFKHFTAEGGIATPLIAHWPKGIAPELTGGFVRDPGQFIDLMPTILSLTGASYPSERQGKPIVPMPGVSLAGTLGGTPVTRTQPMFWEHEGNRAVRDGRWKAVMRLGREWELYDMATDRTEMTNLAAREPDRLAAMTRQWDAWAAKSFVDPWPEQGRTDWGGELKEAETQPPARDLHAPRD